MLMVEKSVYGKAIYQHLYASFLHMKMTEEGRDDLQQEVKDAMTLVPEYRQRYAGKTVPPEKFAVAKSQQYLTSTISFVPAYELFYFYNMFALTGGKKDKITPMMALMDKNMETIDKVRGG